MAALKLKVWYLNGEQVEVKTSARANVMAERYLEGINGTNKIEAVHYVAWYMLNKSGQVTDNYEDWLDTVEDVDQLGEVEPDPTPEAPSSTNSSS